MRRFLPRRLLDLGDGSLVHGVLVLDSVTTDVTFTNSTAENTLYSYTVPGGTLGIDNALRLRVYGTYQDTSAGNTTQLLFRFKYNSLMASVTITTDDNTSADRHWFFEWEVWADAATNVQRGWITQGLWQTSGTPTFSGIGAGAAVTESLTGPQTADSTVAQSLIVTSDFNNAAGNIVTLNRAILMKIAK